MSILSTSILDSSATPAEVGRIVLVAGALLAVLTVLAFWLIRRWQ